MKIINKTKWRTDHLRAIVNVVATRELSAKERKRLILTIVPSRSCDHYCSGHAYIRGRNARIVVPKQEMSDHVKLDFARVLAHELAHIRGATGERWMRSGVLYGRPKDDWSTAALADHYQLHGWAVLLPIERQEPKTKDKPSATDKAESELAKIAAAMKRWDAKRKRAETAIKKYRRKQKYYSAKLHAAACEPR